MCCFGRQCCTLTIGNVQWRKLFLVTDFWTALLTEKRKKSMYLRNYLHLLIDPFFWKYNNIIWWVLYQICFFIWLIPWWCYNFTDKTWIIIEVVWELKMSSSFGAFLHTTFQTIWVSATFDATISVAYSRLALVWHYWFFPLYHHHKLRTHTYINITYICQH